MKTLPAGVRPANPARTTYDTTPPSLLELNATGMVGIERSANLIEMRLALQEFRTKYGPDHWRLFLLEGGRA